MPAGRRWMVVEYLSLLIQDSYEFWVYRTDDYLNSWWTLAELVCFARSADRATHGRIGSAPAIRTVDPVSGRLSDQPGTLRLPLRRRERKQIDGITVFTAPGVSSTASRTLEGRSKPPRGAVRDRSWSSFWNDLLIDRRALTDGDQPYQPSAQALLDGVNDMVVVHPAAAAAAVATDGLGACRRSHPPVASATGQPWPGRALPGLAGGAVAPSARRARRGPDPASMALAGDSAGGGLAVALLVALRDAGKALPAAESHCHPRTWT
jgi:hypothetical protein